MVLLFRSKKKGRLSIEKVFQPLVGYTKRLELPCDLRNLKTALIIFLYLLKIKDKVIHITGDIHYVAFILFWKKSILTIHDLNTYERLQGFKRLIFGFFWFWLPLRSANLITVISPYTKEQLLMHFPIRESKIVVINNSFQSIPRLKIKKDDRFFRILVVGTKENKNIENLIKAIQKLENVKLTIVGRPNQNLESLLEQYGITYKAIFNISEHELAIQYNIADLLFFASTKEGFGLPILEAQSVGLPVITSNTTAMPFVAGKAAIIVNPYCVDEIRNGILEIRNDENLRKELIEQGFLNIQRFSLESFVANFLNLYKTLE